MADNHKNEACKSYLEQTKLLVTLASAFIIAPAVFYEAIDLANWWNIIMELCFILSVLAGYVVFGSISGTQYNGGFYVHRRAAKYSSFFQIGSYLLGLGIFIFSLTKADNTKARSEKNVNPIVYNYYYMKDSTHVLK